MDCRVLASIRQRAEFDEKAMTLSYEIEDDDGEPSILTVKAVYEVCPVCEGKGTHVNPNIDSQGLTREDFDDDPDFRENYMSGMYDMECSECHGKRVVPTPDESDPQSKVAIKLEDEWAAEARNQARESEMGY